MHDVRAEQGARGLPHGRARVRRAEVAPHVAQWDRAAHFPADARAQDGRPRAVRPRRPGGVRRRASGDFTQPVRRDRGARPRRPVHRHHARGRGRPRHQPDPHLRHRGAEGSASCPTSSPAARSRLRPHRARGGLRRRRHPHPRHARRRRVGRQRRQGVHHQLRHATSPRSSPSPRAPARTRTAAPDLARSWCPPAPRASPSSRPTDKLGWHVSDTHGLTFDGLPRPGRQPARRRAAAASRQFLKTLDDGRIAISALAVGCAQACLELATDYAEDAAGLRRARSASTRASPSRSPTSRSRSRPPGC